MHLAQADLIHRLGEVLYDMEIIKYQYHLGHPISHYIDIGLPHIATDTL
jgi:hypothetical protein